MKENLFAIVDVETTGGNGYTDKIIEIAVLISNGYSIIDRFQSLINPERPLPPFITNLTGIKPEMLIDAPVFDEIAYDLLRILSGKIFVAHNVNFDLTFLKEEFKQIKLPYRPEKLCTIVLGRKAFPGFRSYSLGNLSQTLGISINGHHRAEADAIATAEIFHRIYHEFPALIPLTLEEKTLVIKRPVLFDVGLLDELPESPGVYLFKDIQHQIIYIGKSNNIKSRVRSYFTGPKYIAKFDKIAKETAHIEFIETGSELMALLIEDEEIKYHQPKYNRAQKKSNYPLGLFSYTDEKGYLNLHVRKLKADEFPHTQFSNKAEYQSMMGKQIKAHNLCPALCNIEPGLRPCFEHRLHLCNGACIQIESADIYNQRVENALREFSYSFPNFVILDKGRNAHEQTIVLVRHGKYCGRAFIEKSTTVVNYDDLQDHIISKIENVDTQRILKRYLNKPGRKKIIKF